jgi:hypothetical protein
MQRHHHSTEGAGRQLDERWIFGGDSAFTGERDQVLKLGEWLERGEVVVLGEDSFLPPAAGRARLLKHLEGFGRAVE